MGIVSTREGGEGEGIVGRRGGGHLGRKRERIGRALDRRDGGKRNGIVV